MTEHEKAQQRLNAYYDGRAAYREGKENTDNPFSELSNGELFDLWADGYWDEHASSTDLKGECAS
jgi:hypothetical protein